MTNARDKIPEKALNLAMKVLRLCAKAKEDGQEGSSMKIFAKEIEKALMKEFSAGLKVGQQVAAAKAQRATPSKN